MDLHLDCNNNNKSFNLSLKKRRKLWSHALQYLEGKTSIRQPKVDNQESKRENQRENQKSKRGRLKFMRIPKIDSNMELQLPTSCPGDGKIVLIGSKNLKKLKHDSEETIWKNEDKGQRFKRFFNYLERGIGIIDSKSGSLGCQRTITEEGKPHKNVNKVPKNFEFIESNDETTIRFLKMPLNEDKVPSNFQQKKTDLTYDDQYLYGSLKEDDLQGFKFHPPIFARSPPQEENIKLCSIKHRNDPKRSLPCQTLMVDIQCKNPLKSDPFWPGDNGETSNANNRHSKRSGPFSNESVDLDQDNPMNLIDSVGDSNEVGDSKGPSPGSHLEEEGLTVSNDMSTKEEMTEDDHDVTNLIANEDLLKEITTKVVDDINGHNDERPSKQQTGYNHESLGDAICYSETNENDNRKSGEAENRTKNVITDGLRYKVDRDPDSSVFLAFQEGRTNQDCVKFPSKVADDCENLELSIEQDGQEGQDLILRDVNLFQRDLEEIISKESGSEEICVDTILLEAPSNIDYSSTNSDKVSDNELRVDHCQLVEHILSLAGGGIRPRNYDAQVEVGNAKVLPSKNRKFSSIPCFLTKKERYKSEEGIPSKSQRTHCCKRMDASQRLSKNVRSSSLNQNLYRCNELLLHPDTYCRPKCKSQRPRKTSLPCAYSGGNLSNNKENKASLTFSYKFNCKECHGKSLQTFQLMPQSPEEDAIKISEYSGASKRASKDQGVIDAASKLITDRRKVKINNDGKEYIVIDSGHRAVKKDLQRDNCQQQLFEIQNLGDDFLDDNEDLSLYLEIEGDKRHASIRDKEDPNKKVNEKSQPSTSNQIIFILPKISSEEICNTGINRSPKDRDSTKAAKKINNQTDVFDCNTEESLFRNSSSLSKRSNPCEQPVPVEGFQHLICNNANKYFYPLPKENSADEPKDKFEEYFSDGINLPSNISPKEDNQDEYIPDVVDSDFTENYNRIKMEQPTFLDWRQHDEHLPGTERLDMPPAHKERFTLTSIECCEDVHVKSTHVELGVNNTSDLQKAKKQLQSPKVSRSATITSIVPWRNDPVKVPIIDCHHYERLSSMERKLTNGDTITPLETSRKRSKGRPHLNRNFEQSKENDMLETSSELNTERKILKESSLALNFKRYEFVDSEDLMFSSKEDEDVENEDGDSIMDHQMRDDPRSKEAGAIGCRGGYSDHIGAPPSLTTRNGRSKAHSKYSMVEESCVALTEVLAAFIIKEGMRRLTLKWFQEENFLGNRWKNCGNEENRALSCCYFCQGQVPRQRLEEHLQWCTRTQMDLITESKLTKADQRTKKLRAAVPGTICFICGRYFTRHSISIHEAACRNKWIRINEQLPRGKRRPVPEKPIFSDQRIIENYEHEKNLGNSKFKLKDSLNKLLFEASLKNH